MKKYILKSVMTQDYRAKNPDTTEHREHQVVNTSVSHLYEKYRTGRIDDMPQSSMPILPDDNRPDAEKLEDGFVPGLGSDPVEIMNYYRKITDKVKAEIRAHQLGKKQQKQYNDAIKVIKNPNSSIDQITDAYKVLDAIQNARAN